LKPQYHETLSNFAFNFNLRRYNLEAVLWLGERMIHWGEDRTLVAGAYTRPLFSST
jgi:hypothetical protein